MLRLFTRSRIAGLAVLAALAVSPEPAAAQPAAMPADLAVVNPNAIGFVHVRLAEVWHHKAMANMRMIVAKAGPKALAALDDQFVPKPSTAERVTTIIIPPFSVGSEPDFVVALRFTDPFDQAEVLRSYCPDGQMKRSGSTIYFAQEKGPVAVHFPDDRTLVIGGSKSLGPYLGWAPKVEGALTPAIATARDGQFPAIAAINVAATPQYPDIGEQLPPEYRPLARTRLVVATMGLADQVTLTMKMTYRDPDAAAEAEKALKTAAQEARSMMQRMKAEPETLLYGRDPDRAGPRPVEELPEAIAAVVVLGAMNHADEILANLPVKRHTSDLVASVTLPEWTSQYFGAMAMSAGLALPAVQRIRGESLRMQAMNNMKQIGLAMHIHHDSYNHLPPAAITDKKTGKPLLSWRVAILPYIEQQALYQQFKLDEPWDSPANKKAAETMPQVYADPRASAPPGMTYYKAFTGKDAMFPADGKGRKFSQVLDGLSNTVMVVSGGDPVNWAKPDDITFDPDKPLPDLTQPFGDVMALFGDGSVRGLDWKSLTKETRQWLVQVNDGNVIDLP